MEIMKLCIEASQVSIDDPPIEDDETDESGSGDYLFDTNDGEEYELEEDDKLDGNREGFA